MTPRKGYSIDRIAFRGALRDLFAESKAVAKMTPQDRVRYLAAAFEKKRNRSTAVQLILAATPIPVPDKLRPACGWCSRKRVIMRMPNGFGWGCVARPCAKTAIDDLSLAGWLVEQIHAKEALSELSQPPEAS